MSYKKTAKSLKAGRPNDECHIFDDMAEYVAYARTIEKPKAGWARGDRKAYLATCDKASAGDNSLVEKSSALMSRLEDLVSFQTSQFRNVDAMTGGVPNIGAYLAGSPINMRRRQRVMTESAPLNIIVDLTSSAGVSPEQLQRRGACLLAFVRLLSAVRPVNLYIGTALDARGNAASASACRVDTSPLDLARSAYALMDADYARNLSYAVTGDCGEGYCGGWPYNDIDFYRKNMHAFWSRFLSQDMEETMIVAPVYLTDDFADPEAWLRKMLSKYGSMKEEMAA